MTDRPLNAEEASAFRAYAHDLNRQAATLVGADPDLICAACGFDGNENPDGTHAANAHDNLCCGSTSTCFWPGECVTHGWSNAGMPRDAAQETTYAPAPQEGAER